MCYQKYLTWKDPDRSDLVYDRGSLTQAPSSAKNDDYEKTKVQKFELWRNLSTINRIDNFNVLSCGRGKELNFQIVIINRHKVGLQFFSMA